MQTGGGDSTKGIGLFNDQNLESESGRRKSGPESGRAAADNQNVRISNNFNSITYFNGFTAHVNSFQI
jgi:hypothetical protein